LICLLLPDIDSKSNNCALATHQRGSFMPKWCRAHISALFFVRSTAPIMSPNSNGATKRPNQNCKYEPENADTEQIRPPSAVGKVECIQPMSNKRGSQQLQHKGGLDQIPDTRSDNDANTTSVQRTTTHRQSHESQDLGDGFCGG